MKITLELDEEHAALLCGTLQRAANKYPESASQQGLLETVEAAVDIAAGYPAPPSFDDYLPIAAVRTAPGEYDIMSANGRRLWFMEGAALADWVCASVNGYDGALRGMRDSDAFVAEAAALKAERDNAVGEAIRQVKADCAEMHARDSKTIAELERILRDAVGSIKVNDAGDPLGRACPWTVEWFHPARALLSLKRGETFTASEGSTEYVRGFEAGAAFALLSTTQPESDRQTTTEESPSQASDPKCTCSASPSQEHSTYCPREGMDYDSAGSSAPSTEYVREDK